MKSERLRVVPAEPPAGRGCLQCNPITGGRPHVSRRVRIYFKNRLCACCRLKTDLRAAVKGEMSGLGKSISPSHSFSLSLSLSLSLSRSLSPSLSLCPCLYAG